MTTQTPSLPAEERSRLTYRPHVDVRDRGDEVVFVADMPGAKPDSIAVTFDDGVLTVHAAVAPRDLPGRPLRQEYGIGDYRRSFRLGRVPPRRAHRARPATGGGAPAADRGAGRLKPGTTPRLV